MSTLFNFLLCLCIFQAPNYAFAVGPCEEAIIALGHQHRRRFQTLDQLPGRLAGRSTAALLLVVPLSYVPAVQRLSFGPNSSLQIVPQALGQSNYSFYSVLRGTVADLLAFLPTLDAQLPELQYLLLNDLDDPLAQELTHCATSGCVSEKAIAAVTTPLAVNLDMELSADTKDLVISFLRDEVAGMGGISTREGGLHNAFVKLVRPWSGDPVRTTYLARLEKIGLLPSHYSAITAGFRDGRANFRLRKAWRLLQWLVDPEALTLPITYRSAQQTILLYRAARKAALTARR